MTPGQWKQGFIDSEGCGHQHFLEWSPESVEVYYRDFYYGATLKGDERRDLAAICLHQQPFGFTHQDVEDLRSAARRLCGDWDNPEWAAPELLDLADRVEALLPPKP